MSRLCLVTGSSGLIGSEVAAYFGKENSCSILEAFAMAQDCSGKP